MRRAYLLHRQHTTKDSRDLPPHLRALGRDLELDAVLRTMSRGDRFIGDVCERVILTGSRDHDTIAYRQGVLRDCLQNADVVRRIYELSVQMLQLARKHPLGLLTASTPTAVLSSSLQLLRSQLKILREMHRLASGRARGFASAGWRDFLSVFCTEFDEMYLDSLAAHLRNLDVDSGFRLSARLGPGNVMQNFVLHEQPRSRIHPLQQLIRRLARRLRGNGDAAVNLRVDARDESSNRALNDMKRRGVGPVANALARSAKRIIRVFRSLRRELAFYVGCLNLADRLSEVSCPICFPQVDEQGEETLSFTGLYDASLALTANRPPVGNDLAATGRNPVIITGANQGGKTTFLRSLGLAQLMMQCGMFVSAEEFSSAIRAGIFTHFRREEDITLESGKLDEELRRMSDIVARLRPDSTVLLNESFAATNEREGSVIAEQVVCGLAQKGIRVFFVTHLYEFSNRLYETDSGEPLFLRAERDADGKRTYRMRRAPPLQTSFSADLYEQIFCSGPEPQSDSGYSRDA